MFYAVITLPESGTLEPTHFTIMNRGAVENPHFQLRPNQELRGPFDTRDIALDEVEAEFFDSPPGEDARAERRGMGL